MLQANLTSPQNHERKVLAEIPIEEYLNFSNFKKEQDNTDGSSTSNFQNFGQDHVKENLNDMLFGNINDDSNMNNQKTKINYSLSNKSNSNNKITNSKEATLSIDKEFEFPLLGKKSIETNHNENDPLMSFYFMKESSIITEKSKENVLAIKSTKNHNYKDLSSLMYNANKFKIQQLE